MSIFDGDDINSSAHRIFSPDPLVRFQHEKVYGCQRGSVDHEALRKLMLAVLEDGIACFQDHFFKPSRTNKKLSQETEEWINSDDDGIFSFNNICETLDLNPGPLRKGLERWKAKQIGIPTEERKRLILNKGKCTAKKRKAA